MLNGNMLFLVITLYKIKQLFCIIFYYFFVAVEIYKYNMYCKLEKNFESYEGILFHLKSCLLDYSDILSFSENKTFFIFQKAKYQARCNSIWYFLYLLHSIYLLCILLIYTFPCCQIKDKKKTKNQKLYH